VGGTAEATTRVSVNANLQASTTVSPAAVAAATASAGAYDPAVNNMASYDPNLGTGVKPDYSLQIPVSDSQGGERSLEIDFLKSDTPNQWYAEIRAVPATSVQTTAPFVNGQVATGMIAFLPDGKL